MWTFNSQSYALSWAFIKILIKIKDSLSMSPTNSTRFHLYAGLLELHQDHPVEASKHLEQINLDLLTDKKERQNYYLAKAFGCIYFKTTN
jgi:hypothetical protein